MKYRYTMKAQERQNPEKPWNPEKTPPRGRKNPQVPKMPPRGAFNKCIIRRRDFGSRGGKWTNHSARVLTLFLPDYPSKRRFLAPPGFCRKSRILYKFYTFLQKSYKKAPRKDRFYGNSWILYGFFAKNGPISRAIYIDFI